MKFTRCSFRGATSEMQLAPVIMLHVRGIVLVDLEVYVAVTGPFSIRIMLVDHRLAFTGLSITIRFRTEIRLPRVHGPERTLASLCFPVIEPLWSHV